MFIFNTMFLINQEVLPSSFFPSGDAALIATSGIENRKQSLALKIKTNVHRFAVLPLIFYFCLRVGFERSCQHVCSFTREISSSFHFFIVHAHVSWVQTAIRCFSRFLILVVLRSFIFRDLLQPRWKHLNTDRNDIILFKNSEKKNIKCILKSSFVGRGTKNVWRSMENLSWITINVKVVTVVGYTFVSFSIGFQIHCHVFTVDFGCTVYNCQRILTCQV